MQKLGAPRLPYWAVAVPIRQVRVVTKDHGFDQPAISQVNAASRRRGSQSSRTVSVIFGDVRRSKACSSLSLPDDTFSQPATVKVS